MGSAETNQLEKLASIAISRFSCLDCCELVILVGDECLKLCSKLNEMRGGSCSSAEFSLCSLCSGVPRAFTAFHWVRFSTGLSTE